MTHPLAKYSFDEIWDGLHREVDAGNIRVKHDPENDLFLFTYTQQCNYKKNWNDFTASARGLILSQEHRRIVALPFPNEKAAIADFKKVKKQVEVDRITEWRLIFRAETVLDATKKRKKR